MYRLKLIVKGMLRYRLSSVLGLLSLVVAFLGIIILTLYISYERSFDNFHPKGKDIYRISIKEYGCFMTAPYKDLIMSKVPEVENAVIFAQFWDNLAYKEGGNKKDGIRTECLAASSAFYQMFNFPLLQGDPDKVLSEPKTVVVSESLAKRVFGRGNVVGESVIFGDKPYRITGIMKDMPKNTSFYAEAIISFETFMKDPQDSRGAQSWSEWSFNIFYQLKPGVDRSEAEAKMSKIEEVAGALKSIKSEKPNGGYLILQPLGDLHYSDEGFFPYVNKKVLDVLFLLAIMLVIMGGVNFINFATSQAPLRSRSLSIQQILGEKRWRARLLIIGEAVLLSLIAFNLAYDLHWMTYSHIQDFFGISGLSFSDRYIFVALFALCAVVFGIVAGLYPSYYITSPPIAQAVKGKMFFSGKGKTVRSTLIVVQFIFTIALIASAFTIEKQLNYWSSFEIGINKKNVLYLRTTPTIREHYKAFAEELMKNSEITDYSYTQFIPGGVGMGWGREVDGQRVSLKCWPIDDRFFHFFDIKIVQGRKFLNGEGDINNFILNEKAVQIFGWEKPLEKRMPGFDFTGNVIGVAKNFNFSSLKEEITPMMFWLTNERKHVIFLRANATNYSELFKFITTTASKFDPENKLEARFLDDSLNKLYDKEIKIARFIESVAVWCILLALTGLLGLIIFITRDKVKEIGIRKVHGAKAVDIVSMLNNKVLIWLTVAFAVAVPIAYYAMNKWLHNFAYKTELSWWIFALAGIVTLAISFVTVTWHSWRTAKKNPVEALRYE